MQTTGFLPALQCQLEQIVITYIDVWGVSRSKTVVALTEMLEDPNGVNEALEEEIHGQMLLLHKKRAAIDAGIRCPITNEVNAPHV